jgi:hypothetical protein
MPSFPLNDMRRAQKKIPATGITGVPKAFTRV